MRRMKRIGQVHSVNAIFMKSYLGDRNLSQCIFALIIDYLVIRLIIDSNLDSEFVRLAKNFAWAQVIGKQQHYQRWSLDARHEKNERQKIIVKTSRDITADWLGHVHSDFAGLNCFRIWTFNETVSLNVHIRKKLNPAKSMYWKGR